MPTSAPTQRETAKKVPTIEAVQHDVVTPWFTQPRGLEGRRIWLVGAGGTGVSGLARLLQRRGACVRGGDREASAAVQALCAEGFDIAVGADLQVPADTELVVATAAAKPDHPQLVAAAARGIPVRTYAESLGLMQKCHTGVSVAGTHGKSTTTCLLTWCLMQAQLDPGFIAGATCASLGGSSRTGALTVPHGPLAGTPGFLVAESCEFDRSFHKLHPTTAIINNVEADHLDCYGSLEEIVESFRVFAQRLPAADAGGFLLIAHDGAHRDRVAAGARAAVETFGANPSADHVVQRTGDGEVRVRRGGRETLRWTPRLLGEHNALNGAAAGVMALRLGADRARVEAALASFAGVDRRMEFVGACGEGASAIRVYDDYGHHPTEVRVTLEALRRATQPRRLLCLFQPHQHSRTRLLLEDFGACFGAADHVLLTDIYFVRDHPSERSRIRSEDVADRVRAHGQAVECVGTMEAGARRLRELAREGDVVVTMGAGPIFKAARMFLQP